MADDQRYCLECGERRVPMSSVLLAGPPSGGLSQPQAATTVPPPHGSAPADGARRGNTVTVIAGVGVLLLAMGIGVLIGRSGDSKPAAAPAQVISVAQPGATTTGSVTTPTTTTPEASAKGGSPSSKNGSNKGASEGSGGSGKNAPPATPKSSSPGSGKSYVEKSKNLPNVVETR